MLGGVPRRTALLSLSVALGVTVALAPSSDATVAATTGTAGIGVPKLNSSCGIPPFASAHYLIRDGHATSGTWTLAPRLTCDQPKRALSIGATLIHDGHTQFWSAGACQAKPIKWCKAAVAPSRAKSYTTTIRGKWWATVSYSITGPDAILFSRSSSRAGSCKYDAVKMRATCHYDTAPVVIR